MKGRPRRTVGALATALQLEDFESLAGELKPWKAKELQELEGEKGSGLVLGFVKGLRLSARLIYALRKAVASHGVSVHWGHLLDASGDYCSAECDVILHKGHFQEWNGHREPVMDFKFIKCDKAIAVISCKSYAKSVDAVYPGKLKRYVKKVFLFSECCAPRRLGALRKKAISAGYSGFACVYTYDEKTGECVNVPQEWRQFLSDVLAVVKKATGKRK